LRFAFDHRQGCQRVAPVHLYYQAALMTAEIRDEAFDRVGALEAIDKSLP
jgi:hypothetical protein